MTTDDFSSQRSDQAVRSPRICFDLGVYGFDRHETTILASLVTEGPLVQDKAL